MPSRDNYQVARLFILSILLLMFGWSTWAFCVKSFHDVIHILSLGDQSVHIRSSDVNNGFLKGCYSLAKLFSFAGLFLAAYMFYRAMAKKGMEEKHSNPVYKYVASIIYDNRVFLSGIVNPIRTLFLLMIVARTAMMLYYMFTMPYHYDETLNYRLFSGQGVMTSLVAYTLPNNHIFHSIVSAWLIQLLPWDPYLSMRLCCVAASVCSIYYVFKLCRNMMSDGASFFGTAFFAFSYPFFFYSVQARGYAFLILFTVLLLYAFVNIVKGQNIRKYLVLYLISIALGSFTVPTFIYVAFPVGLMLFVFYLHKRRNFFFREFFLVNAVLAVAICLSYLPMLLTLGYDAFDKVQKAGIVPTEVTEQNIRGHLSETWMYLVKDIVSPYAAVAILAICLGYAFYKRSLLQSYFVILICLLVLSPYPLILAQGAIPFARTWTYLIIPIAVVAGILADLLLSFRIVHKWADIPAALAGVVVVSSIIVTDRNIAAYRAEYDIDHKIKNYLAILKPKFSYLHSIGRGPGFCWYISETIDSEAMKDKIYFSTIYLNQNDTAITGDLVIVDNAVPLRVPDSSYNLIPYQNPYFSLYLKKGL
ncbi:MAG: DUF2723 domain-containing protein [Sphingobacteriales bacterium]|nr:MAG: DUF2723 domain-containing protein [Sphingobacteriales bacterium]